MTDLDQIKYLDSGMADAINTKDGGAIRNFYTDDGAIMPPGAPMMEGIDAIQDYWQAAMDAGLSGVSIVGDSIDIDGDTALTVGTLSGEMGGQPLSGKYIVSSRRTKDGWRIHRDIWNFDA
ncbi:YybH family protein [Shimia sp. W99]